jgi:hypothetical protein
MAKTKLSDFLFTEILAQKLRKNPDKHYIQMIQTLSDKGQMTKEDFINTGRMMEKNYYFSEFGYHPLFSDEVKDVMRYAGGFCVQVLPTGEWLFDTNDANESDEVSTKYRSPKLSDVENELWHSYVQKKVQ